MNTVNTLTKIEIMVKLTIQINNPFTKYYDYGKSI